MIRELGYCSGIENYSRYFDGRKAGTRPFCLLDYFPKDFLMVIDESHVTLPQIRAMFGGDHSRKQNLVDYGFRLPAAIDNRPLTFEEFENIIGQTIFVSVTLLIMNFRNVKVLSLNRSFAQPVFSTLLLTLSLP